ncbi:MAG: glycogen debranching enzyme N-terminal domain-containing protein, partial [Prevotellaceae bacterium]|nr:glycogen debranching enzyme N-terminal domain-containing protein [Prevotellaceae bacterium]
MSKISFDKISLSNLSSSLKKEILLVGENGCFCSTSIVGCNTRKYHGLFIYPQKNFGSENYLLLSQFGETVEQQGSEFHLDVRKYAGGFFEPKGHKYLEKLEFLPYPCWTYRVGGVQLKKETVLHKKKNILVVKYTLLEAHSPTTLRISPLLAFRNVNTLTHKNSSAEEQVQHLKTGIKARLYEGFTDLYIECASKFSFASNPLWYNDVEYSQEIERGYEAHEDLFAPGEFIIKLEKGKSVYFTVGVEQFKGTSENIFKEAGKFYLPADGLDNCLKNAASDFIVRKNEKTEIIAGYPWFGSWGRDTFISLPGLTLSVGKPEVCLEVLRSMLISQKGAMFPNVGEAYNSVDAPLWFIWAVQKYAYHIKDIKGVWKEFGSAVKQVLDGFYSGEIYGIRVLESGLVYAGEEGRALTWMDAIVNGKPVTQRAGCPVEINALWYNAMMFAIEAATAAGTAADKKFIATWKPRAEEFPQIFKEKFWDKEKSYLADVVDYNHTDWSFRPNQIIAVSMPYMPISEKVAQIVVNEVRQTLRTTRGLRTLSPMDANFEGLYEGSQRVRDEAYHQGTVWVWLLGHYAEAYLKVYGDAGKNHVKHLYEEFDNA